MTSTGPKGPSRAPTVGRSRNNPPKQSIAHETPWRGLFSLVAGLAPHRETHAEVRRLRRYMAGGAASQPSISWPRQFSGNPSRTDLMFRFLAHVSARIGHAVPLTWLARFNSFAVPDGL